MDLDLFRDGVCRLFFLHPLDGDSAALGVTLPVMIGSVFLYPVTMDINRQIYTIEYCTGISIIPIASSGPWYV